MKRNTRLSTVEKVIVCYRCLTAAETNIEADNFPSENGEGINKLLKMEKEKKTNITMRACLSDSQH